MLETEFSKIAEADLNQSRMISENFNIFNKVYWILKNLNYRFYSNGKRITVVNLLPDPRLYCVGPEFRFQGMLR